MVELKKNAAGSYTATVTDTNGVLSAYNFAANSGGGITFTWKSDTLTITATAAAAKNLDTEKTYSATGSAYEIDPDRAVICWYDRTGRYQAMAGYTGVGRDPVKAYIKIKAVEEKGSITVRKVDATGAPLAGAELLLETSADGKTWTEVGRITTDKIGVAKWENLKTGVQFRITEVKAPAGYTLMTEPLSAALAANATTVKNALETAVKNGGVAMTETDATGHTTADQLEQGLYLIVETRVPENVTSTCNPFFVSLPMTTIDGAAWNYDVTVYPKNQTGNPTLDKTVREAKNSTGKNNGRLTNIQSQAVIHLRPVTTKGGTKVPPLVVVQQFVAIGAGLCRQVDMTDFIQRREINAFHICFDLVIAERVTRLRNQTDKCVLAVVQDNELMVARVNRHCLAARGSIRPFVVFMGIIQRKAVDAHASFHPTVYGNEAEAFLLAARTPIIPEGEGTVVPYPIFRDTLP